VRPIPAIAALLTLTAFQAKGAEEPSLPVKSVQVEIRIGGDRAAIVQEHYRFTRPVTLELRYLTGPCSDADRESMTIRDPAGPVGFARSRIGPWVLLTPEAAHGASPEYWVSYKVPSWTRTTNVPIVLASRALESPPGAAMGIVDLRVVFPVEGDGATVVLPQMQRDGLAGIWSTTMLALPSFIRVRFRSGSLPDECPSPDPGRESAEPAGANGSSGSLEWWVLGFAASLVAWVAFYMRWANSRRGLSKEAQNSRNPGEPGGHP
jgi:hypothetical protein